MSSAPSQPRIENLESVAEFLVNSRNRSPQEVADLIKAYADAFAYQGFDPARVLAQILKRSDNKNEEARQKVVLAIAILCHRGTKIKKIKEKSSENLKDQINALESLLSQKTGNNLTRDDVTLPRIAAVFPELAAMTATKIAKRVLPGFQDVHPLITSHFFAAVCPSESNWVTCAKVNLLWLIEFDKFVKPKNTTDQFRQLQFWKASHSSPLVSNLDRIALMKHLNLDPSNCDTFVSSQAGQIQLAQISMMEMSPPVIQPLSLNRFGLEFNAIPRPVPRGSPDQPQGPIVFGGSTTPKRGMSPSREPQQGSSGRPSQEPAPQKPGKPSSK